MAMMINGVTIPASIANRGKYKFKPAEEVNKNGLGEPVYAGCASVEWTFGYMTFSAVDGFDWWAVTMLENQRFQRFSGASAARLTNDMRVEIVFSNCIVYRPTYENIFANWYENVVVKIDQIM